MVTDYVIEEELGRLKSELAQPKAAQADKVESQTTDRPDELAKHTSELERPFRAGAHAATSDSRGLRAHYAARRGRKAH